MNGIELLEIREEMGLTQLELADMLGITRPTLSRAENLDLVPKLYEYSVQLLRIKQQRIELRDAFERTLRALK